jgi:hypothetical protein
MKKKDLNAKRRTMETQKYFHHACKKIKKNKKIYIYIIFKKNSSKRNQKSFKIFIRTLELNSSFNTSLLKIISSFKNPHKIYKNRPILIIIIIIIIIIMIIT